MEAQCASGTESVKSPPAKLLISDNATSAMATARSMYESQEKDKDARGYSDNTTDSLCSNVSHMMLQADGNNSPPDENKDTHTRGTGKYLARHDASPRGSQGTSGSQKRKMRAPKRTGSDVTRSASEAEQADDEQEDSELIMSSQADKSGRAQCASKPSGTGAHDHESDTRKECRKSMVISWQKASLLPLPISPTLGEDSESEVVYMGQYTTGSQKGKMSKLTRRKCSQPRKEDIADDPILSASRDLMDLVGVPADASSPREENSRDKQMASTSTSQHSQLRDTEVLRTGSVSGELDVADQDALSHLDSVSNTGRKDTTLDVSTSTVTSATDTSSVHHYEPKPVQKARKRNDSKGDVADGVALPGCMPQHRRYAKYHKPKITAKFHKCQGTSTDEDDMSCWEGLRSRGDQTRTYPLFERDPVSTLLRT